MIEALCIVLCHCLMHILSCIYIKYTMCCRSLQWLIISNVLQPFRLWAHAFNYKHKIYDPCLYLNKTPLCLNHKQRKCIYPLQFHIQFGVFVWSRWLTCLANEIRLTSKGVSLGTGVHTQQPVFERLCICELYVWVSQKISGFSQRHGVDYGITGSP